MAGGSSRLHINLNPLNFCERMCVFARIYANAYTRRRTLHVHMTFLWLTCKLLSAVIFHFLLFCFLWLVASSRPRRINCETAHFLLESNWASFLFHAYHAMRISRCRTDEPCDVECFELTLFLRLWCAYETHSHSHRRTHYTPTTHSHNSCVTWAQFPRSPHA